MKIIIQFALHVIDHEGFDGLQLIAFFVLTHCCGTEFRFRLRLKNRIPDINVHRSNNSFSDVGCFESFSVKFTDGFYKGFLKSIQMCSALRRVLSVYKGKIGFRL